LHSVLQPTFTILPYCIPLCSPFTTAHGTQVTREGAIVEIFTAEGITGLGEIAPMLGFGDDNLNDALRAIDQSPIVSDFLSKRPDEALNDLYRAVGILSPSTVCGLEIALLDVLRQAQGCSMSELLTQSSWSHAAHFHKNISTPLPIAPKSRIHVNAVIAASALDDAANAAKVAIATGFGCLKLKLGMGVEADIERIHAVREAIGPSIHLRLDANEAWGFDQACTILTRCAPLNIQYVEQPLKAGDLMGMYNLRQAVAVPIAADEAIVDLTSARRVLASQAADVLILKPQVIGGLRMSRQIIEEAWEQGVQCVITSVFETAIGIEALVHLVAASPEITLECGLATLHMLKHDLLFQSLPGYKSRFDAVQARIAH
jgi:o-succinylbenzoate synthase